MSKRVETGPVQFDDDWPGVFIRGDNALGFAQSLEAMLNSHPSLNFVHVAVCQGLLKTLKSCHVRDNPDMAPTLATRLEAGNGKEEG